MKRFIIASVIALALVSVAAVRLHHSSTTLTTEISSTLEPSTDTPLVRQVEFADTSALFKPENIRNIKASPEEVVRAWKLSKEAGRFSDKFDSACFSLPLLKESMRLCPFTFTYYQYNNAMSKCNGMRDDNPKVRNIAEMLQHNSNGSVIVPGAAYALAQGDTALAMDLLDYIVYKDSNAFKVVNADKAFRALENYPQYYYLMDYVLQGAQGQMAALRTVRLGNVSGLPYELTHDILFKQYRYKKDKENNYTSPYTLQDDAMRDLIRGNRFNRFSRMSTDHSVQYVTTLHLSDKFHTFICSRNNDQSYEDDQDANKVNIPYNFHLVTVNKTGYKIAEQQIGCSCSPIHISMATVDSTGAIEVREMKQIWKKDPLEAGYKNNEVASTELTAVKHYRVKEDGKIEAVNEATAKE